MSPTVGTGWFTGIDVIRRPSTVIVERGGIVTNSMHGRSDPTILNFEKSTQTSSLMQQVRTTKV